MFVDNKLWLQVEDENAKDAEEVTAPNEKKPAADDADVGEATSVLKSAASDDDEEAAASDGSEAAAKGSSKKASDGAAAERKAKCVVFRRSKPSFWMLCDHTKWRAGHLPDSCFL